MAVTELVIFVATLLFADLIIRCILVGTAFYAIVHRPLNRQRSHTLQGDGKESIRVALLGDSVLYGENSRYPIPAVQYVAQDLMKRYGAVTVDNYAVTRDTIRQLIEKQLPKVQKGSLIFIYVGGNDYFRFTSTRRFSLSVDRLLEKLKGETVIWCTLADPIYLYLVPIWLRYIYRRYATEYMDHVEEVIRRHPEQKWYTIDFRYEPAKRLKAQKIKGRSLLADGFHLNDAGHKVWAKIVQDAYSKLKQQGAQLP